MKTLALLVPAAAVAAIALTTGCAVWDLLKVRETEKKVAQYGYIKGTVAARGASTNWMVVYVARVPCDDDWRALRKAVERGELALPSEEWSPELQELADRVVAKTTIVQHVVLQRPGLWYARLAPGCYGVGAFEDVNHNYEYDDEPATSAVADPDQVFELSAGESREDIDLVIPPGGRLMSGKHLAATQVSEMTVRSHGEQLFVSLDAVSVEGEVADLADPRFGQENGKLGYFDIYTFLWRARPGIYFLEPYDPDRVPVLFVHGALGYPQVFEPLIESLDRERFQPWFFYYPSGARLDGISDFLSQAVTRLQLRHGFDRLVVVAHSMGGLVSRSFILKHHERVREDPVRLFVSISTPWGGVSFAETGVEQSPIVVPSWNDVAPSSAFLRGMFFEDPADQTTRKRFPDQVNHHLVFGVEDRTISLASAIRWEALRDAADRWPLPYDHTEILKSREAATLLQEILAREIR